MANPNPFARSTMKIQAPVRLVSSEFNGWSGIYNLEYLASRSAADVGALQKQFKVGATLVIEGKHLVVRKSTTRISSDAPSEMCVTVEALDFAAVLAGATGIRPASPAVVSAPAPRAPSSTKFGAPRRRLLV